MPTAMLETSVGCSTNGASTTMNTSDSTIIIHLNQGYQTIIDDIDSDLAALKWRSNKGYAIRWVSTKIYKGRKLIFMHREILSRKLNRPLETYERCDHIDGNPSNNCRNNLRLATPRENSQNRKVVVHNTSGYTGVCFDRNRGKWRADIKLPHKRKFLGHFSNIEDAIKARKEAEQTYFGEFARKSD